MGVFAKYRGYLEVAAALALIAFGWYLGSRAADTALANERAQNWHQQALDSAVGLADANAKIKTLSDQLKRSEASQHDLEERNHASDLANADLAERLRQRAQQGNAPRCVAVPKAGVQPEQARTGDEGTEKLAGLCADLTAEAERNVNAMNSARADLATLVQ